MSSSHEPRPCTWSSFQPPGLRSLTHLTREMEVWHCARHQPGLWQMGNTLIAGRSPRKLLKTGAGNCGVARPGDSKRGHLIPEQEREEIEMKNTTVAREQYCVRPYVVWLAHRGRTLELVTQTDPAAPNSPTMGTPVSQAWS